MDRADAQRLTVLESDSGARLDSYLAERFTQFSRVQIRRAIDQGRITVDGKQAKPAYRLVAGQHVDFRPPAERPTGPQPEAIPLDILFEDEDLAVINKPAGMVVHPAKGHWSGTLTAALTYHFQSLSQIGGGVRPGIVHRLDRDTSGVIVVARHDQSHLALADQFQTRAVDKEYVALVRPAPDRDRDVIDKPIGAHPHQREKMAIRDGHATSRQASTYYEVRKRFGPIAQVHAFPKTGRTHQIRVHLAHIGCPILADRQYSGRGEITRADLVSHGTPADVLLKRQALHALRIAFKHPRTGEPLEFTAPLPDDMKQVLACLKSVRR